MKIYNIVFDNDVLLGSINLNFTNTSDGKPYSNVIFVGENGTGKTTILNLIYKFCAGPDKCDFYSKVDYEIDGSIYRFERFPKSKEILYNLHDYSHHGAYLLHGHYDDYPDYADPSRNHPIFSFSKNDGNVPQEQNFDSIIERLIKIQEEDCINYTYYNIKHKDNPMPWTEFFETSKMKSFANSFNQFFEDMTYFGMGFDQDKHKVIGFTKKGHEIKTSSLSSGEKQIIERAVPFLEKMNDEKNNLCLIDEPEISLHPKWQEKILSFYINLFSDADGHQNNQLIIASHSSALLKEALARKDTLVIRLYEKDGSIEAKRISPIYLNRVTYAEVNFLVFGISSPEYHNQLYCQIQNKFNVHSVKKCDSFIANHAYYNVCRHEKMSSFGKAKYKTICSYIRNSVDHYNNENDFTEEELVTSIKLMQDILRE